jgi:hypothetical protein
MLSLYPTENLYCITDQALAMIKHSLEGYLGCFIQPFFAVFQLISF